MYLYIFNGIFGPVRVCILNGSIFPFDLSVGVYLPLLWEASFCWKTPIALAYTRGHFSALLTMPRTQESGAGVWSNRSSDDHVTYLPLVDGDGRQLKIHFLTEQEVC